MLCCALAPEVCPPVHHSETRVFPVRIGYEYLCRQGAAHVVLTGDLKVTCQGPTAHNTRPQTTVINHGGYLSVNYLYYILFINST
jgi:hypothetical protein